MSPLEMGMKSVVVNLSDLAAMGAHPLGIIISMGLPPDLSLEDFDLLISGILKTCQKYDIALLGGDTNQTNEITICGTALGMVNRDKVLMKYGARDGDLVAVTGVLGSAAAGFEVLSDEAVIESLNPNEKQEILKTALKPEARVKEGTVIAKHNATSCTDITDGLVSEMGEIIGATKQKIGIRFYEDKLPIRPALEVVARRSGKSAREMVLYYGEDFELLFTINHKDFISLQEEIEVYAIGEVTSSGRIEMIDKEGKTNTLIPMGYQHLYKS
jgi:thiamine-monophosphate kinase